MSEVAVHGQRRVVADIAGGVAACLTAAVLVVVLGSWTAREGAAPAQPRVVSVNHVPPPPPMSDPLPQERPQPALVSGALPDVPLLNLDMPMPALVLPAVTQDSDVITWAPVLPALPLADAMLPLSNNTAPRRLVVPDLSAAYPHRARRYAIEGRTVLQLQVDNRGRVIDIHVVSSQPEGVFDNAAKRVAKRLRYEAAIEAGQPVPATVREVLVWRLK